MNEIVTDLNDDDVIEQENEKNKEFNDISLMDAVPEISSPLTDDDFSAETAFEMPFSSPEEPAPEFTLELELEPEPKAAPAPEPQPVRPATHQRQPPLTEIPLTLEIMLGRTRMSVAELTAISRNDLICLDQRFGEPVEILVNGQQFGRGEIVDSGNEQRIGIRMLDLSDAR